MTLIHKEVSPHGDWIVYMNGVPLYKKWPSGHSVLFDKYGPPISSADRDALDQKRGTTEEVERQPLSYARGDILALVTDTLTGEGQSRMVTRTATRLFLLACDLLAWKDQVCADAFEETSLRDHFSLSALISTANEDLYPEMPHELRSALNHHLALVPGLKANAGLVQHESTWAFHQSAEEALLALLDKMPLTHFASTPHGKSDETAGPPISPTSSNLSDDDTLRRMAASLLSEFTSNDTLVERCSDLFVLANGVVRWKETKGFLNYSLREVRDHFNLKTVIRLTDSEIYPTMPDALRAKAEEYLNGLPGYRPELSLDQSQTTTDEHGVAEMQLAKLFPALSETYEKLSSSEPLDPFWIAKRLNQRPSVIPTEEIPEDILEIAAQLDYMRGGPSSIDIAQAIFNERKRSQGEIERLRKAADYISPYLRYTISEESPGYHPTMPSAVDAFHDAFDISSSEKRLARARHWLPKKD